FFGRSWVCRGAMKRDSRSKWVAFHRAVWASVVLHTLAVGVLVLLLRESEKPSPTTKGIDTRAAEPQVRISLRDDRSGPIEESQSAVVAKPQEADSPPSPVPIPEVPQTKPEVPSSAIQLPSKPFAPSVPQTLPPELLSLLRKPAPASIGGRVVEVPVPAGT